MPDETTVIAEHTAPESVPEITTEVQSEESAETPASESVEESAPTPVEKQSRSSERISQTIAQRKAAEESARVATEEAAYWKAQALAQQSANPDDDEIPGVTDEGIDPREFAKWLKQEARKEAQAVQNQTLTNSQFNKELAEVKRDPILNSASAQRAVSRIIDSENVSPLEALELYKEEIGDYEKTSADNSRIRDKAGQFVRDETKSPVTGRGSSSGDSYYTKSQIDAMGTDEYQKNIEEINRQVNLGLIK